MNGVLSAKTKKIGPFLAKMLLLFMVVYKSSIIPGVTFITSELLVLVILAGYFAVQKKITIGPRSIVDKCFGNNIFMQVVLLVYSSVLILLLGAGNGALFAEESFFFLLFVPLIYLGLTKLIRSLDEFMSLLLVITLLQCAIILLGMVFSPVADLIDNSVFNQGITHMGGYSEMRKMGYPGGIACIAAKGSLQLSLGLISCFYFIVTRSANWIHYICYIFITLVMTAVARTGLMLSAVGIMVFIFTQRSGKLKIRKDAVIAFLFIFALLILVLLLLTQPSFNNFVKEQFVRLEALFDKGIWDSFLKFYFYGSDTVIPPLSWETFIGTGILSGVSGNGIEINADGAFFKMYAAVGPIFTIIFYVCLFRNMLKSIRSFEDRRLRSVGWLFVWFMAIGEFKELFFYTRYMILLFYVFAFLANNKGTEQSRNIYHCQSLIGL